ncbi:hypothetical protein FI667_g6503, partial [Globisporangium splendens]
MTRDAGASRTFRSIFHQELQEDELRIHMNRDENGIDDDDDDALWSDDAAPKARGGGGSSCSDGLEDTGEDGKGEQQHGEEDNNMMLVMDDDEEDAADDEVANAPRSEELRIPHRRSMEEWADDDDEEDTWKDMLQAKVNQLELVIQQNSNNHMDTAATLTSTNITINGEVATNADGETHVDAAFACGHDGWRSNAPAASAQTHVLWCDDVVNNQLSAQTKWVDVFVLIGIHSTVGKGTGRKEDGSDYHNQHTPWLQVATIFNAIDCWAHAVVVLDHGSNVSEKLSRRIHRQ